MSTIDERDTRRIAGEELERELRTYASVRLSPDRFASDRMRAAVLAHARTLPVATPLGIVAAPRRLDFLAAFRLGTRRLAPVALVAAIAIGAGSAAGVAASPGGPLYQTRIWLETALLPAGGEARADAQAAQLNERIDEITGAVDDGDVGAADAAANAYDQEVDQAVSTAAQSRADLLQLRATIVRHLAHLQSIGHTTDKATANLQKLIAKDQAALATIDAKLAALPSAP
jgi:hypothetical protein